MYPQKVYFCCRREGHCEKQDMQPSPILTSTDPTIRIKMSRNTADNQTGLAQIK
jgi:hypothetical protein